MAVEELPAAGSQVGAHSPTFVSTHCSDTSHRRALELGVSNWRAGELGREAGGSRVKRWMANCGR